MKIQLVEGWRGCLRWYSVHFILLQGAAFGTWAMLPPDWRDAVPRSWLAGAAVFTMAGGIAARVIQQPIKGDSDAKNQQ